MMKLGRRKTISIVNGNFDRLFTLAEKESLKHNMDRADRYVELARKIGMRYNVSIPAKYKRRFCKHC
ncbi:MAG: ribonuclease P protein component 4, partial [Candidatus Thermoplasmatota archaeon]|nr:ribonuclease P protein component 4 [Candidatus Thermoplasmatota archaeon]